MKVLWFMFFIIGALYSFEGEKNPSNELFFNNKPLYLNKETHTDILTQEERAWISKNPTIILASADDYIHLAFRDNTGIIRGFDADLIAQINQNLGINITQRLFDGWDSTYDAASKGEVDGIFSLSHTKERESTFNFSPVYHQDPTYIITRQNEYSIKTLSDLNDKVVATENNSIINDILLKEAPSAKLIHAPTIYEILQTVQTHKAHVALLEGVNQHNMEVLGLKIASSYFTKSGEYTIGTHKNKPILGSIINKGIQSISKNQMQLLKDKWFDTQYNKSLFTSEELEYINKAAVIRIGIENWAPMISIKDGNHIEGIVGELLTRVIEISGLKTELVAGPWSNLLRDFKEKKIDILPATYYTDERSTYGLFSDTYTHIRNVIYVNKDNDNIKSFTDLNNKTLAIQKGFGTIDGIRKKFPSINIIETPNLEDAIIKVSNKEADALFEAQIVAQDIIQKLLITNLKPIFQNNIEAGTLHIFSKKDDFMLQSIINKSLQSIPPQEKNNIIDKWLHQDIKKNVNAAFTKNREPYSMENSLSKGIEYDIVKKVLGKSNVVLTYEKFLSRSKMEHALIEDSKLDLAVGIKQKNDAFYYSDALVGFENVLITRDEGYLNIQSIEDMKDKKIIAFESAYKHLGKEYNSFFNLEKRPPTYSETSRQDEQVLALINKKVDAIILDKNIFFWHLKKLYGEESNNYKIHSLFPEQNVYKVAFKDKNLRDIFNQNLHEIKKTGEYADILYTYLQTDIESKTKISALIASLVAKSIFTEDVKKINEMIIVFSTLPYLQKIEVFNNENELLVAHSKEDATTSTRYDSFHHIAHIPHKVGYVKVYFNENKLAKHIQTNSIIPNINLFSQLSNYSDIKEAYKKLDFLDKPSFTQKEEEFIKKYPIINFASVKNHLFYLKDKEKVEGLLVDFLKIIEHKSGLTFEYSTLSTQEELHSKFNNKEIDLMMDDRTIASPLSSNLLSENFVQFNFAIIANEHGDFTRGLEDLKGKVAVPKDSIAHRLLKTLYPSIHLIETQTAQEALSLVGKGKVDAYVGHEAEATYLLQTSYPNLKIIGISKENISHILMAHTEHPELISIINKVLKTLTYEQKQEVKDRWFKTKINTEVDYSIVYKVASLLLLIILLGIIYNQRLKYLVNQKTLELEKLLTSFDKNVIAVKIDDKGKIIYVSDALCKISEYPKNELIGNTTDILTSKTNKRILKNFKKAFINQTTWNGKLINISKSGKVYWTKTKLFPEYDQKGKFLNYTIISQDITAQKEVELLYKEIEDTQKEIIFKMGAIGEARSEETGLHVKRVAEYSRLMALHYGLTNKEANIIKLASPMHDIGKVAIADSILNKAGKLTDIEFAIIKTHAELGYEMLKNSHRTIIKTAAIIAHEHHEKYDGTGYPRGLRGEEIHIYGRITAIADVFDALGNKRVYKEAWDNEMIFEFLRKERGKHFDPKLVDIFFENIEKFLEIKNSFKDA